MSSSHIYSHVVYIYKSYIKHFLIRIIKISLVYSSSSYVMCFALTFRNIHRKSKINDHEPTILFSDQFKKEDIRFLETTMNQQLFQSVHVRFGSFFWTDTNQPMSFIFGFLCMCEAFKPVQYTHVMIASNYQNYMKIRCTWDIFGIST